MTLYQFISYYIPQKINEDLSNRHEKLASKKWSALETALKPVWNRDSVFFALCIKALHVPYYSSSMNHRMTWFSQVFFGGTTTYFSVLTNTRVLNCTRTWIMTCLSTLFSHLHRTGSYRLTMPRLYMIWNGFVSWRFILPDDSLVIKQSYFDKKSRSNESENDKTETNLYVKSDFYFLNCV